MEAKKELMRTKKAKQIAFLVIVLILLNQAAGWYFSGYPAGFILVAFILVLSSRLNYVILFKSEKFELSKPVSKKETKRLKIEIGCNLLVIGSICLLLA